MQCVTCSFPKGHSPANRHYSIPEMPSRDHVLKVALHIPYLEIQLLSVFPVTKDPTSTKLRLCLSINTDCSSASTLLTEDGKGRENIFRAVAEQRLNTSLSFSLSRMQDDAVATSLELFTHVCSPCMPHEPEAMLAPGPGYSSSWSPSSSHRGSPSYTLPQLQFLSALLEGITPAVASAAALPFPKQQQELNWPNSCLFPCHPQDLK